MAEFTQRVSDIGYNAVSLDDLAHLADHAWYEPAIRSNIGVYREEFRRLFDIIYAAGLAIYLTMDVLSATPLLKQRLGSSAEKTLVFLYVHHAAYLELFRLSDEVIKELLYIEEFARQKLFFRRVRIPPLIGVFWNTIFISHSLRKIIRYFVTDPETCVRTGYSALGKIKQMKVLAEELNLPVEDIVYMQRTFKMLTLARQYFFYPYDESMRKRALGVDTIFR
jgi:hypothetical protein